LGQFTPNVVHIPKSIIAFTTIEGLEYISKHGRSYKTLKRFGKEFNLHLQTSGPPVAEQMTEFYDELLDPIKDVISQTLIGV